ncbi:MAG: type IX secretion system membrane protein PorP/SprF [Bacteroidales bacterium]|nr:type IX secretion system membrane protein PorP/SprF [Bacteroidales bacterium]
MNKFKKFKISFLIIFLFVDVYGQDFIQFQNIPQHYNSAFAGINKCSNIVLTNNFHHVAPSLNFFSNTLIIDTHVPLVSGGIKLEIEKFSTPGNVFSNTYLSFAYAYQNKFNKKNRFSLSLQGTFFQENINISNLVFSNMIDIYSNTLEPNSEIFANNVLRGVFFGGGAVFYGKSYYFSFFVENFFSIYATTPKKNDWNLSLIAEKQLIKTNKKYNLHYNSAFFFNRQFLSISNGVVISNDIIGCGMFVKELLFDNNLTNALSPYFTLNYKNISIGYSYSFYLGTLLKKHSSEHELNLKIRFNCREKNGNNTIICPAYKL